MTNIKRTRPLDAGDRDRLQRVVAEIGEVAAANELACSRLAMVRALAGLPIRLTVATTLRLHLDRLGRAA